MVTCLALLRKVLCDYAWGGVSWFLVASHPGCDDGLLLVPASLALKAVPLLPFPRPSCRLVTE